MNNSLIIKGADFSQNKVGKLNIQKLTVTKGGNGAKTVNSGAVVDYADVPGAWYPSRNTAYSAEIALPSGTKYLFGKINLIAQNSAFNTYKNNPSAVYLTSNPIPTWIYHNSTGGYWSTIDGLRNDLNTKPFLLGYKSGLFQSNNYTVALFDGGIYGERFNESLVIDKIIVNWFRPDGEGAPEIGIELPELYVAF